MKLFQKFFLILFCTINFCFSQTEYHVATNGNDTSGNGTIGNPYATIDFAVDQTVPGDFVLVHAGTYRNSQFNNGDIWEGDNLIKINDINGSPDNYITIKPYANDKVLLEFDANYGVLIQSSSYIIFEDFEVKGISDIITQSEADDAWGLYIDNSDGLIYNLEDEIGINYPDPSPYSRGDDIPKAPKDLTKPNYYSGKGIVANKSHHIIIRNNIVHNTPGSGIRSQQSDYVTISNNEVYNCTFYTTAGSGAITVAEATVTPDTDTFTGVKTIIDKNYVHHNENRMISYASSKDFLHFVIDEGTGIFLTRNNDTYAQGYIQISNNISSYNGASGIVCHKTNRAIIEHNTAYKNGTTNDSAAGGIGINNTDDVTIKNNISYAEPDHWAIGTLAQPNTNLIITNNLVYNENGSQQIYNNLLDGWVQNNPLLVDAELGNFRISPNSPTIDAGTTTSIITDDFNGTLRNDGNPDIGAYEYTKTETSSFEMVKKMGRGINLGNVFSAPTEGNWSPAVEQKYFQDVAEAGFSTVRIPMDFYGTRTSGDTSIWSSNEDTSSDYTGSINDYTVSEIYLDRIEEVIDWAIEAGLIVIIDIHGSTLKTEFQYTFDRKNTHPNERTSPTSAKRLADLDKFTAIWTAISNRFMLKSENLLFEVINEPYFEITAEDMNSINSLIINTIRNTGGNNTTRNIIITGGTENSYLAPTTIDSAIIANNDYLIATFHYYNPNDFTKSSEDTKDQETWGSANDKNNIDSDFNVVYNWASVNNIPILLGEFGADNTGGYDYSTGDLKTNSTNTSGFSDGGPEDESRVEFHRYLAEKSISLGFAFTAWDAGPRSNKTIHKRNDASSTINYNIDYFSVSSYNPKITTPSTVIDTSIWVENVKDALLGIIHDDDNDGIQNSLDVCPETPVGEIVNPDGCSESQLDDDNDGVQNSLDLCPNTTLGTSVNSVGCYVLSSNNFAIEVISETCPDKDNGQINISSLENYSYTTTINGIDYSFTNDITVDGLAPGLYNFCIGVTGETYEQCFVVEVVEGTTVSGKSSIVSRKALVEIEEGTAPFTIYVNQKELFKTSSPIFNIDVKYGDIIEVRTAVPCEGVYSETLKKLNELIIYPNPVQNTLFVNSPFKILKIEIFNLQGQRLISQQNNVESADCKSLAKGIYFLKIYHRNGEFTIKKFIKN